MEYYSPLLAPLADDAPKEGGGVADYFNVTNSVGMLFNHPEMYGAQKDEDFRLDNHKDYLNTLTNEEYDAAVEAISEQDMYNKVNRIKTYNESLGRISNDSLFFSIPAMIGASLIDPVSLVPIGGIAAKAIKLGKTGDRMRDMMVTGGTIGTLGAATNVASEALLADQGLPHDYGSAALYGFAFGGALGALGESLRHTKFRQDAIENIVGKDDLFTESQIKLPREEGAGKFDADGNVSRIKSDWLPNWAKSNVAIAYNSVVPEIRNLVSKLVNPHTSPDGQINIHSAHDTVQNLRGFSNDAQRKLRKEYNNARENGYKGSRDDFFNEAGTSYTRKQGEQERTVKSSDAYRKGLKPIKKNIKALKEKLEKTTDEAEVKQLKDTIREMELKLSKKVDDLYAKARPKLTEAEEVIAEYFNKMLKEAQEAGVSELRNIGPNRLYMPRHIDYTKLRELDPAQAKAQIYNAFRMHPDNAKMSEADIRTATDEYYNSALTRSFERDSSLQYMLGKERFGVDSRLKGKISLDTSMMLDILDTSPLNSMSKYGYWMDGQIAVRKALPELQNTEATNISQVFRDTYVNPLRTKVQNSKLDAKQREVVEKEIEAVDEILQDLLGSLRISPDSNSKAFKVARVLTQANAATMSGMMGLIQTLEIPAALWATGFNRIFHRQFGSLFADVNRAIFKGEYTEFTKELVQAGHLTSTLDLHGINRVADTENVFNAGRMENAMFGFTDKIYKFNGMRTMTAWLEAMVGSNVVTMFRNFNGNVKDVKLFERWGISKEDAKYIQSQLLKHGEITDKGVVKSIGIDKMEPAAAEMMNRALTRAIQSGVIQGSTFNVPSWMKIPSPMKKLMFQFWRYPMAANEILLKRGFSEDQAGMIAATSGATLMGMAMFSLIEQAEIATGLKDRIDQKYDITTDDGLKRLVIKSLSYSGTLSGLTLGAETLSTLTGLQSPLSEYRPRDGESLLLGASHQRFTDMQKIIKALSEGQYDSEALWRSAKHFVPLQNAPLVSAGLVKIIEDSTVQYY